ncbi:hypothetical protein D3C72_2063160 [compost metagenome]
MLNTAETNEFRPFASTPPFRRFMYSGPETGCSETSEVAVMSPMVSSEVIMNTSISGRSRLQSMPRP